MDKNKLDISHIEGNFVSLILQNPMAIYDTSINKKYFHEPPGEKNNPHKAIFSVMEYLAETKDVDKLAFDSTTIATLAYKDEAVRTVLNKVFDSKKDTIKYLDSLKEFEVNKNNIDIYENELKKAAMTNTLLDENEKVVEDILNNYEDYESEEILNKVENKVLKVNNDFIDKDRETEHISNNFKDNYLNAEPNEKGFKGLSTPFEQLDKFTSGILRDNSLTVFAALSGVGKSVILKQLAKHVGIDLGLPILWIGTEQPKVEQRDRLIAEIAGVNIKIVENRLFNLKEKFNGKRYGLKKRMYDPKKVKEKIIKAGELLKESEIYIDKMESATPESILRKAKFYKKKVWNKNGNF